MRGTEEVKRQLRTGELIIRGVHFNHTSGSAACDLLMCLSCRVHRSCVRGRVCVATGCPFCFSGSLSSGVVGLARGLFIFFPFCFASFVRREEPRYGTVSSRKVRQGHKATGRATPDAYPLSRER